MDVMDPTTEDLYRFGVALAIGALIGIERQFSGTRDDDAAPAGPTLLAPATQEQLREAAAHPAPPAPPEPARLEPWLPKGAPTAGVRTYTLFALTGATSAFLAPSFPWLLPASLVVIGALILAGYVHGIRSRDDMGLTSEISCVITFLLGAMAVTGHTTIAGACAVVVTGLLALKRRLHELTWRIKQTDILAALKFAVITVVILPILPDDPLVLGDWLERRRAAQEQRAGREEGPDQDARGAGGPAAPTPPAAPSEPAATTTEASRPDARSGRDDGGDRPWYHDLSISPRKVWYMVVLISGVSFAGYVLVQVLGEGRGLFFTGALGGLASSTAVSLSFSQRSQEQPELSPRLAMGILIANAIMPLRLLLIIAFLDVRVALHLAVPLLAMVAAAGLYALGLHLRRDGQGAVNAPALKNPFEITPALKFGAIFAAVLILAQVAEALFGAAGTYGLALVSGLTDVDAIGLALSTRASAGGLPVGVAAVGIAIAAASNTVVKGGFVVWFGAPHLRRIALAAFGLMLAAAIAGIVGLHLLAR